MEDLNNSTYRVLRYIYRHPYIAYLKIAFFKIHGITMENIDQNLEILIQSKMISLRAAPCKEADIDQTEIPLGSLDGYLVSLPLGDAYVESHIRSTIRHWIPVAISNLIAFTALVISIIALLKP